MNQFNTFALDIASYDAMARSGARILRWPTEQKQYEILSYDLPRGLTAYIRGMAGSGGLDYVAAISCLFDIYLCMARLGRAAIDLTNIRQAGGSALFDPVGNPILAYLQSDTPRLAETYTDIIPDGEPGLSFSLSAKDRLRALKRDLIMIATPRSGRCDALARGGLIENFLSGCGRQSINFNPYLVNWPSLGPIPRAMRNIADALTDIFQDLLERHVDLAPGLAEKVRHAADLFAQAWLNRSWHNARHLQRWHFPWRIGDVAVGTSPKMLGRLLGHLYQSHGKTVIRCAHGGERPFFDDDHWGLSEFPFCDRYLGHSHGEADAIARRHREGRLIRVHDQPPVCVGLGSQRHQNIYTMMHDRAGLPARQAKKVMFVASSFLGEFSSHIPAIKPADVLIADLEIQVMSELRKAGFEILFKPHPKAVIGSGSIYQGCFDALVSRPFDPLRDDVDVYVFDYAGSAFFDALASRRGVVLIDTKLRPFDPTTIDDLLARIEIVPASADEQLRLRVNPVALAAATKRAGERQECPDWFARRYFDGAESREWIG